MLNCLDDAWTLGTRRIWGRSLACVRHRIDRLGGLDDPDRIRNDGRRGAGNETGEHGLEGAETLATIAGLEDEVAGALVEVIVHPAFAAELERRNDMEEGMKRVMHKE